MKNTAIIFAAIIGISLGSFIFSACKIQSAQVEKTYIMFSSEDEQMEYARGRNVKPQKMFYD